MQLEELKTKNKHKVGAPFRFSDGIIAGFFTVKCAFKIGYRQLEGFVKGLKAFFHLKKVPNFRTINWRLINLQKYGLEVRTKQSGRNLEV